MKAAESFRKALEQPNQPFERLAEPFRRELKLHCYRMLGSVHEAEDLAQETYLRAWRNFESFNGEGSFRAWLYRIASSERRASRRWPGLGSIEDFQCAQDCLHLVRYGDPHRTLRGHLVLGWRVEPVDCCPLLELSATGIRGANVKDCNITPYDAAARLSRPSRDSKFRFRNV
jgi:hypothetical protein